MSEPINLQAVVLRLRAAVIAARSQIDERQLNSLMGILDSLLDVAYAANAHQLAALLEPLLDAVRDTIHGVGWKSEIPSVDTAIMAVPADTTLATGMTSQPSLLRDFLTHVVTKWARTAYATDHVQVTFDDQLGATTYGANTFAWAAEVQTEQLPHPIPIEVALDTDGYMSVHRIAMQVEWHPTVAAEHAHAVDAASRPRDRGFFETQNRHERDSDLSVAAQLMGKPLGRPISAIPSDVQYDGSHYVERDPDASDFHRYPV